MKIEGTDIVKTQQSITKQPASQQQFDTLGNGEIKQPVEQVSQKSLGDMPIDERVKEFPEYIPSVSEKAWVNTLEAANKKLEGANTEFRFSVHEATKQITVKVLNKDTGEVIREIPPEKILDMVAKMWEMSGLFVDERR